MARGKLVVFSSHCDLTCYMPNVSLATLAGSLLANKHEVTIEDYGTTDEIERLAPPGLRERLRELYPHLMGGGPNKYVALFKLSRTLRVIDRHHQERVREIAENLLDKCERERIDFIGFQGWVGQSMRDTIYTAEHIKRYRPETKVFLGGATVDQVRGAVFRRTDAFDAVSFGDGDEAILQLARYSEGKGGLRSVPNIIFRDGNETVETERVFVEDLDSLPFAVFDSDIYPAMEGNESKIKIGVIDDSRGCANRCFFCPHLVKSGNKRRSKSPQRMVDEVRNLGKFGMTHWRKAGSNPAFRSGVEEARLYLDKGLQTFWTSFAHANQIDPGNTAEIELLRDSGLLALSFGIEHGDPGIRKRYFNKRIGDNERIKRVLQATMNSGIYTVGSFIYPAPFETEESTRKTLELLCDAFSDSEISSSQFYPPGLFPQSQWGRDPEAFGFRLDRPEEYPDGYVVKAMGFVLNRRLPPNLWRNSLPYSLNGRPFKKVLMKTYRFCKDLEGRGLSLNVPEEYVLFWHGLGQEGLSVDEFSKMASRSVYTMDSETMKSLALRINENSRRT